MEYRFLEQPLRHSWILQLWYEKNGKNFYFQMLQTSLRFSIFRAKIVRCILKMSLIFISELSKYIPDGKLDPLTFQTVMDAANAKYYLAKVLVH